MAGFGTKVFIFGLLLSFCFNLWAGTKVTGLASESTTYQEEGSKSGQLMAYVYQIEKVIKDNIATSLISAVGIVFGNPYLAFAGIALTMFQTLTFPQALLNESLGDWAVYGSILSNLISALYALAAITWFAGRGDF